MNIFELLESLHRAVRESVEKQCPSFHVTKIKSDIEACYANKSYACSGINVIFDVTAESGDLQRLLKIGVTSDGNAMILREDVCVWR